MRKIVIENWKIYTTVGAGAHLPVSLKTPCGVHNSKKNFKNEHPQGTRRRQVKPILRISMNERW